MIVVADTGPVNYLILSGQIGLAHELRVSPPLTPRPPLVSFARRCFVHQHCHDLQWVFLRVP